MQGAYDHRCPVPRGPLRTTKEADLPEAERTRLLVQLQSGRRLTGLIPREMFIRTLSRNLPNGTMSAFRTVIQVLAVIQAFIAGFTALVGSFANGGDLWARLLLVLVHPISALGMLLLAFLSRPARTTVLVIMGLLVVNVVSDLALGFMIAQGVVKGDFWLPLIFAAIPAIGFVYALTLTVRQSRTSHAQSP